MDNRVEYLKALYNAKNNAIQTNGVLVNPNEQSTQVGNIEQGVETPQNKPVREPTWYEKVFGFIDDVAREFGSGFVRGWEGMGDFVLTGVSAIGEAMGQDMTKLNDYIKLDLGGLAGNWTQSYMNFTPWGIAKNLKNYGDSEYWANMGQDTIANLDMAFGGFGGHGQEDIDRIIENNRKYAINNASTLTDMGKSGEFIGGIAGSIGQRLPSIMVGNAVGAKVATAKGFGTIKNMAELAEGGNKIAKGAMTGVKAVQLGAFGLGAGGQGSQEALNEGASAGKALAYGAVTGSIEVATELGSDVVAKGAGKLVGKLAEKYPKADVIKNILKNSKIGGYDITHKVLGVSSVADIAKNMIEEGVEEVESELLSPLAKSIYKGKDALKEYKTNDYWKQVGTSFASGAVMGGIMDGVQLASVNASLGKGREVVILSQETNSIIEDLKSQRKSGKISAEQYQKLYEEKVVPKVKEIDSKFYALDEKHQNKVIQLYAKPEEFLKEAQQEYKDFDSIRNDDDLSIDQKVQYGKLFYEQGLNTKDVSQMSDTEKQDLINKRFIDRFTYYKDFDTEIIDKVKENFKNINGKELNIEYKGNIKDNAFYDPKNNTIVINEKNKEKFYTAIAHEGITHALHSMSSEAIDTVWDYLTNTEKGKNLYKKIMSKTTTAWGEDVVKSGYSSIEDFVNKAYAEEGKTKSETTRIIKEEKLAHFMQELVNNYDDMFDILEGNKGRGTITRLLDKITTKLDKTGVKEVYERFRQAVDSIKSGKTTQNSDSGDIKQSLKPNTTREGYTVNNHRISSEYYDRQNAYLANNIGVAKYNVITWNEQALKEIQTNQELKSVILEGLDYSLYIGKYHLRNIYPTKLNLNGLARSVSVPTLKTILWNIAKGKPQAIFYNGNYESTVKVYTDRPAPKINGEKSVWVLNFENVESEKRSVYKKAVQNLTLSIATQKEADSMANPISYNGENYYVGIVNTKSKRFIEFKKYQVGKSLTEYFDNETNEKISNKEYTRFLVNPSTRKLELSTGATRSKITENGFEYKSEGNLWDSVRKRLGLNKDAIKRSKSVDSEGNVLTEEQQKWHEGNKFVDNDGNPMVLYHGTIHAGFTVFDNSIFRSSGNKYNSNYAIWSADRLNDGSEMYADNNLKVIGKNNIDLINQIQQQYKDLCNQLKSIDDEREFINLFNNNVELIKNRMLLEVSDVSSPFVSVDKIYGNKEWGYSYGFFGDKDVSKDFGSLKEEILNELNYTKTALGNYKIYMKSTNPLVIDCKNKDFGDLNLKNTGNSILDKFIKDLTSKGERVVTDDIVNMVVSKMPEVDGVIFKNIVDNTDRPLNVYVTLRNPNQVKFVDNLHPTRDADIRYSKSAKLGTKVRKYIPYSHFSGSELNSIENQVKNELNKTNKNTVNDFVAIHSNRLYIVDGSINSEKEIQYGIYKYKIITKGDIYLIKEELENDIKRKNSIHNRENKENEHNTRDNVGEFRGREFRQGVQSIDGTTTNNKGEISSSNELGRIDTDIKKSKSVYDIKDDFDLDDFDDLLLDDFLKGKDYKSEILKLTREEQIRALRFEKEAKKADYDKLSAEQKRLLSFKKSYERDYDKLVRVLNKKMSPQTQEYFKNSVIRGGNSFSNGVYGVPEGMLVPMFHGTPSADMFHFDPNRIGTNGVQRGFGFYLTDNLGYAEGYADDNGKVIMAFVNITKPLSDRQLTFTKTQIKDFVRKYIDSDATSGTLSDYGDVAMTSYEKILNNFVDGVWEHGDNSDWDLITQLYYQQNDLDFDTFFKAIKKEFGYDGYVAWNRSEGTIAVAFDSNQIKDINNQNPTPNKDFRLSKSVENKTSYINYETTQDIVKDFESELKYYFGNDVRISYPKGLMNFEGRAFTEINKVKNVDLEGRNLANLFLDTKVRYNEKVFGEEVGKISIRELLTTTEQENLAVAISNIIRTSPMTPARDDAVRALKISLDRLQAVSTEYRNMLKPSMDILAYTIKAREDIGTGYKIDNDAVQRDGFKFLLKPFAELERKNGKFSVKGLEKNIREVLAEYTENKYNGEEGIIDYYPEIVEMYEELLDTIGEPQTQQVHHKGGTVTERDVYGYLNSEQLNIANNLIRAIDNLIRNTTRQKNQNTIPYAVSSYQSIKDMKYGVKTDVISKTLRKWKRGFAPSYVVVREITGASRLSELITTEGQNALNNKVLYNGKLSDEINNKLEQLNIKNKISKRIVVNGVDMTTQQALYLYLSTQIQANREEIAKNGAVFYDKNGRPVELIGKGELIGDVYENETLDKFESELDKTLSPELKSFGNFILEKFNNQFKEDYIGWYEKTFGEFNNRNEIGKVGENTYFPLYRYVSRESSVEMMARVAGGIFTNAKRRFNNTHPVAIGDVLSTMETYAERLSNEIYVKPIYRQVVSTLNQKVEGNKTLKEIIKERTDPQDLSYLTKTLKSFVGVDTENRSTPIDAVMGNYAIAKLSLNIGSMLKQYASIWTSNLPLSVSTKAFFQKVFGNKEYKALFNDLVDEIGGLKYRKSGSSVIEANAGTVRGTTQKIARVGMKGITEMDYFTISVGVYGLMGIGANELNADISTPKGKEAIKKFVVDNWTEFELSQIGSGAFSQSAISRGDYDGIVKGIFGFLQGANRASFGSQINKIDTWNRNRKLNKANLEKALEEATQRQENAKQVYEEVQKALEEARANYFEGGRTKELREEYTNAKVEFAEAERNYVKANADLEYAQTRDTDYKRYERMGGKKIPMNMVAGLMAQGVFVALISELMKHIKGKKDWDEWGVKEMGTNTLLAICADWIPLVNTFSSLIQGYETSVPTTELFNQIANVAQALQNKNWRVAIKQVALAVGDMTGLPFQTVYQYIYGTIKTFDPETAWRLNSLFYNSTESGANSALRAYANRNNAKGSTAMVSVLMNNYKTTSDDEINKELSSLYLNGYRALPSSYMTSYTDEKGEEVNLNAQQIVQFREIYNTSYKDIKDLLALGEYRYKTQEQKAKTIKSIYNAYYDFAKAKTTNIIPSSKLGKMLYYSNGKIKLAKLSSIINNVSQIAENKKMSKKELTIDYINKQRTLSKAEKVFVMYLCGYSVGDKNKPLLKSYLMRMGVNAKVVNEIID